MKGEINVSEYLPPRDLWPDLLVPKEFKNLPEELNLADELLDRHLREGRAGKTVIYFEDQRITYQEIARQVNRLGDSLMHIGIHSRDRVGIRTTNLPEAIIANFAILKIGAIPVPMSPLWSRKEIIYVAQDALLRALVVNRSLLGEVQAVEDSLTSIKAFIIVNDVHPGEAAGAKGYYTFEELVARGKDNLESFPLKRDDIAILIYTSGTTGLPKGCAHTVFGVLINSCLISQRVWDLHEGDVLAGSAPISFAAGYGTFALIPFTGPGAISLLEKYSPGALLQNIARHRVTFLTGIPTAYRKLLEVEKFEDYDLSSLKVCTAGGEGLGKETFDAWLSKTGLPLWENFGATELFHMPISNRMGAQPRRGSIGLPLPGVKVKVVDENDRPCSPGTVGTMCIKGPTGIIYWNPRGHDGRLMKAQQKSVKNGWNILGDAVYQDEEGYLFFVSREDDIIKSSGYRLSPQEIEEVLIQHPLIREAAVVGVPDPILGQMIKAFVVLNHPADFRPELEKEIKEYCQSNLAIYKIPRIVKFVSHLPKTPTGKILRKELQ